MRIVALEEHFIVPSLVNRIDRSAITRRGFPPPGICLEPGHPERRAPGAWRDADRRHGRCGDHGSRFSP